MGNLVLYIVGLGFLGSTALMLAEWFAPGLEGVSGANWPRLLLIHAVTGHMLAGSAAILVGQRLRLVWLSAAGWLGLALQSLMMAFILAKGAVPATLFDLYGMPAADPSGAHLLARYTLALLPRLLFLLALLVWVRPMARHGLVFTAATALCFVGLVALLFTHAWHSWTIPQTLAGTQIITALSHSALYVPLLLALPAFLLPRMAPARLVPLAWTGGAATTFLVAAVFLWGLGAQGMQTGSADVDASFASGARQVVILSAMTLALWLAALWVHRR